MLVQEVDSGANARTGSSAVSLVLAIEICVISVVFMDTVTPAELAKRLKVSVDRVYEKTRFRGRHVGKPLRACESDDIFALLLAGGLRADAQRKKPLTNVLWLHTYIKSHMMNLEKPAIQRNEIVSKSERACQPRTRNSRVRMTSKNRAEVAQW